ncbi:SsrA-binding protein SmpB [Buchnera aphidicola]|uniref:SsrA-binding protein n=1 Tax=Buchnera aphidicola subsp. Melaphis rhois TaxID=118103 RepID=A0A4D6YB84_BUCMH|nr:SsrA-binding protein SmpB [Buchnera aphidicola]QCI23264.1 SsrA-binding protein SmpB [Buchnera aphidicola (Melaphis rhois)]
MKTERKVNNSIVNIVVNRKIKYRYFIKETLEAGLVLLSWEVKSFKLGHINISDSYVLFNLNEAYLTGAKFNSIYTTHSYTFRDSNRNRKILLHKNEITLLYNRICKEGYSAVTLSCFLKNSWCKIKIAIVKGKTKYDKRETEKKSQWNIEKNRLMKKSS